MVEKDLFKLESEIRNVMNRQEKSSKSNTDNPKSRNNILHDILHGFKHDNNITSKNKVSIDITNAFHTEINADFRDDVSKLLFRNNYFNIRGLPTVIKKSLFHVYNVPQFSDLSIKHEIIIR